MAVFKRNISAGVAVLFTLSTPVRNTATRSERGNVFGASTGKRMSMISGSVGWVTQVRNCASLRGWLELMSPAASEGPISTGITGTQVPGR
jgi:hypothetical protein